MATNRVSPKKGKVVDIPDSVVTIGTPTAGAGQVSVAFTASSPATGGPVQKYTAVSNPDSVTVSGSTSPVVVTGLTNGTAYTFQVAAANATGNGVFSSASASATPTVPDDYESIATVNVGSGGSSSISFSSIPSTYKHLQIRYTARSTVANVNDGYTSVRFNGDSTNGNYYFYHILQSDGASLFSGGGGTNAIIYTGVTAGNSAATNVFGSGVIDILDYTSTSKNKVTRTLSGMDNNGAGKISLASGFWFNTAAVTSITLGANAFGNNFMEFSSFALYGIRGA
jgi:hypothetical protein